MENNFKISNIEFKNNIKEDFAFETTILFQLIGNTKINFNNKDSNMNKGDISIINRNTKYYLENSSNTENVLIKIEIDNSYFISIYDDFLNTSFEFYPDEEDKGKIDNVNDLRTELSHFILYYSNHSTTRKISLSITMDKIILSLISYFKRETDVHSSIIRSDKIMEIIKYIDKNFYKEITIEELASRYYMSSPALSKLFKEETGKLFNVYLNETRVNKSLKDLLYSRYSIEEIALKNGFNNSRTYRRRFHDFFNESPTDYKKNMTGNNIHKDIKEESFNIDDLEDVFEVLYSYINLPKTILRKDHIIENNKRIVIDESVDRNQILPSKIIHIGSLDILLEKEVNDEFRMTVEDIGIDYVGISSIYTSYPDTYLSDDVDEYYVFSNYGKFDPIVRKLMDYNIGVFYELRISEILDYRNNNYNQLIDFLKNAKNIFKKGFFVNFKVNLIFDLNNISKNYYKFKDIYNNIKEIDENISIGASIPCKYPDYSFLTLEDEELYVNEIVKLSEFLSFTSDPNSIYDLSKNLILDMEFYNEYVYKETKTIKTLLNKWNVNLPLFLTEWNTLTGEKQNINGTFFRGAIILQEILKLDLLIEAYGFWLNAAIYKNYKFDKSNQYNGLELFHNYSGKKPVYNVLALASRLNGKVKFLGRECMLVEEDDEYQLLLWNPNYFNPKLSEQLKFLETQSVLYNIKIPSIKNNYYQIKRFDFNRNEGALYYNFQKVKSRFPIDLEAREYITNISVPKISVFDANIVDGFEFSFELDTNAIILLEFKPKYK